MVDFFIDVVVDPKKSKKGIDEVDKSLKRVQNSANRTEQLLKRAFTVGAIVLLTRRLSDVVDTFISLETRLGNVTSSAREFNDVFDALQSTAQKNGASIASLADVFVKLNVSLSDNLKQGFDLVKVTDLLARGFAAAGTTASTAAGATLQLTQALATNFKTAGQELNAIIEGAPLVARTIAVELGGNAAIDLKRFAREGKLTAKSFLDALIASEDVIKSFRIPPTIERSFQRLKNSFTVFLGESVAVRGVVDVFTSSIDALADNFDTLAKLVGVATAALVTFFLLLKGAAIVAAVTGVIGFIGAFISLAATITTVAGALALLGTAFLVNPLFLIPVIVVAAIAALVLFKDKIADIAAEIKLFGTSIGEFFAFMADSVIGTYSGLLEVVRTVFAKIRIEQFKLADSFNKAFGGRFGIPTIDLDKIIGSPAKAQEVIRKAGRTVAESFQEGFDSFTSQGFLFKQLTKDIKDLEGIGTPLDKISEELVDLTEDQEKLLDTIKGPIINYKKNIEDLNLLLERGKINQEEYTVALRGFKIEVGELDRSLQGGLLRGILKVEEEFTNLSKVAEDTVVNGFKSMEDALVDFVTTGKVDFKSLIDSMLADIARLVIRQQITAPLAAGISSVASSAGGDILSSLFGFSHGGSFTIPGSGNADNQVVAFKGTPGERVTVSRPDQVGGGRISVNIINNTSSEISVRQAVDGQGQRLEVMVDEAVARNINTRNSSTNKALRTFGSQGKVGR